MMVLNEVTGLVEWPVALSGEFEKRFLELPSQALISSMQGHQKYFPVEDATGKLLPFLLRFVISKVVIRRRLLQVMNG